MTGASATSPSEHAEHDGAPPTRRGGPQHIPRPPDARSGDPAPWRHLDPAARQVPLPRIQAALAAAPAPTRHPLEGGQRPGSAVLVPVYEHEGQVHVVLTRRAWHLRAHRGEVSFPGGRQEPGETLWETALRESWEETGMEMGAVERIGELHHLATITSQSFIVPYVGVLPGRPDLEANPDEVDAILHVPIAELLHPEVYRQERWGFGGVHRPIHFFELVGDTVWGATGSMLVDFLNRAAGLDPEKPVI